MKIGKSEFIAQSPDTLILDFEGGYALHPGVTKLTITKWTEIKQVIRQLETPEAKAKYKNVAFDTIAEAWDLCTAFTCSQAGVQKISEIPYGAGYKDRDNEFANVLRKIITMGYGLLLTCHVKEKVIETKNDIDVVGLSPDVDKRCLPIINGLVDLIGIIHQTWEGNESKRWLITKSTPTINAGSRLANLEPKIPFGYKYLEDAIIKAISEQEESGIKVVEKLETKQEVLDFNSLLEEARELWDKLIAADENNATVISKKIEIIFGRPLKLSQVTEDQVALLELVVIEMRELASKI